MERPAEGGCRGIGAREKPGWKENVKIVIPYGSGDRNRSDRQIQPAESCEKFKIRRMRQLRDWLKAYNSGKDLRSRSGDSRMKSTRKAAKAERIRAAGERPAVGNNCGGMV